MNKLPIPFQQFINKTNEVKVIIYVDFHNKDLIKSAGGKWDSVNKTWYINKLIFNNNFDKLMELQKSNKIYFVKEWISRRTDRELIKNTIDVDYKLCGILNYYTKDEIIELFNI